jgi:hypothetical protein
VGSGIWWQGAPAGRCQGPVSPAPSARRLPPARPAPPLPSGGGDRRRWAAGRAPDVEGRAALQAVLKHAAAGQGGDVVDHSLVAHLVGVGVGLEVEGGLGGFGGLRKGEEGGERGCGRAGRPGPHDVPGPRPPFPSRRRPLQPPPLSFRCKAHALARTPPPAAPTSAWAPVPATMSRYCSPEAVVTSSADSSAAAQPASQISFGASATGAAAAAGLAGDGRGGAGFRGQRRGASEAALRSARHDRALHPPPSHGAQSHHATTLAASTRPCCRACRRLAPLDVAAAPLVVAEHRTRAAPSARRPARQRGGVLNMLLTHTGQLAGRTGSFSSRSPAVHTCCRPPSRPRRGLRCVRVLLSLGIPMGVVAEHRPRDPAPERGGSPSRPATGECGDGYGQECRSW